MKKVLIALGVFQMFCCGAFADSATKSFRNDLAKCEKNGMASVEGKSATEEVNAALLSESNCYISVGNAVIKKFYANTRDAAQKNFIGFANASYHAAASAYIGPDECYPECGQMAEELRTNMTTRAIRQYITDMLDYIDNLAV
jgi:hypothetical protein